MSGEETHVAVAGSEVLGEGVYGEVSRCACAPGCSYVIKTWSGDDDGEERESELGIQERLPASPHLLRGARSGEGMVMRYLEPVREVPLAQALRDVMTGIAALARCGIAHCDLKVDNLGRDPETGAVVIYDFGNALDFADPNPKHIKYRCTLYTRPPETYVHRRSDVWSGALAAVEASYGHSFLVRFIYGRKPLGDMFAELSEEPGTLEALRLALREDPEERADAEGVLAALHRPCLPREEVSTKKRKLLSGAEFLDSAVGVR